MANIEFSPKQREVIDTRGKNILVSAAAGSGKTAVLVQRIIERVLGNGEAEADEKLVDIDKILVLTYTEAAAGEMRERIERAINEKMQEFPEDKRIAEQAVLVHNAQISTIHGFCLSLIRNNFTEIEFDPTFRVAENGEIQMIEDEIVDELIEELFEGDFEKKIKILADRFSRKNSLDKLKEIILDVYGECRNQPFIDDYIEGLRGNYAIAPEEDILDTAWGKELLVYTREQLKQAKELTLFNQEYCESGPYMYEDTLESDLELIEGLISCNTYEEYHARLKGLSWARLSGKKDEAVSEESKKYSQSVRNEVKEIVNKLAEDFYENDSALIRTAILENGRVLDALADVLLMLNSRLEMEKRKRKIIDFSDMEHYALRILLKKEGDEYVPTQIAKDYRAVFEEIMVDEYQDSNHVQEYIITAISGEADGIYNRFMVGDVKQSIYSFRNACPELFMSKYDQYDKATDNNVKIDLSTNYRSRNQVLESVNKVFEKIMGADLGGIDYTDEVRLNLGAEYNETGENYNTELLLLNYDDETESRKQEQEARMVALKVNELVNGEKPFILEGNRPCQYSDIVILLRSNKGWDDVFKTVLEQHGIPAYVASKTGYFSATEIKRILNLLQVLDNPRCEIELYGVLSTFGGFSEDELATVRAYSKDELCEAIKAIAEGAFEHQDKLSTEIIRKCENFYKFLDRYRQKMVYTPINELLEEIISETGYMYQISSMPFGEQRRANVFMLIEKAKQYENGSFKGLYHFVRYINEIQSFEIDYGEASTLDEQSNVVRIMSIHKSKGLEFPICFVCGMGKSFNISDSKNEIITDRSLGIAFDYVDTGKNVKYSDIRRKFISRKLKEDSIAEEIRVLYVAMTRAKEKLFMTACQAKLEDMISKCSRNREISGGEKLLTRYARSKSLSFLELMLTAVDLEKNNSFAGSMFDLDELDSLQVETSVSKEQRKADLKSTIQRLGVGDESENINMIKNKIMFKYLHEDLAQLYTKTSVSELKIAAIEKAFLNNELEETSAEFFTEHEQEAYIPKFVNKEEKISGTTRGTAYHRVMELFFLENTEDFADVDLHGREKNEPNVAAVIKQMIEKGKIDEDEAGLVDTGKIVRFLKSDLGERMLIASAKKKLYLEEPFVLGLDARLLNNTCSSNETVLIQGIIDAFFIENGKVVLMDYKTDKVSKGEELVKKYQLQLDYYKEAIERILGLKVEEKLIYSFALDAVIES